jgi:hypothetical protein
MDFDWMTIIGLFSYGMVCYWLGKITMMHSIIDAVVNEHDKETASDEAVELKVEKINNVYYAYVGGEFVAQAETFKDLVRAIKSNNSVTRFAVDKDTTALSEVERTDFMAALVDAYTEKK